MQMIATQGSESRTVRATRADGQPAELLVTAGASRVHLEVDGHRTSLTVRDVLAYARGLADAGDRPMWLVAIEPDGWALLEGTEPYFDEVRDRAWRLSETEAVRLADQLVAAAFVTHGVDLPGQ